MANVRSREIRGAPSGLADLGRPRGDDGADRSWDDGVRSVALTGNSSVLAVDDLPGELVVPVFPFDGDGFVRIQIQLVRNGERLLAAGFTSQALLVERLGEFQPWLRMAGDAFFALLGTHRIDGLIIDPLPAQVGPVWTQEALSALDEANDVRL